MSRNTLEAENFARKAIQAGHQQELEVALSYWTKALALKPLSPSWLAQLGRVLMRLGREQEGLKLFIQADALKPGVAAWRIAIAELRRRQARPSHRREPGAGYYNQVYRERHDYRGSAANSIYLPIWARIVVIMRERHVRSVADLGCGPGQFAEYLLSQLKVKYWGYDFSGEAIALARSRNLSATFYRHDILKSRQMPRLSADAIVATEFLEHIEDDLGTISRLKKGTFLIGSVPNFDSFGHVRYFLNEADVRTRYSPLLEDLRIEVFPLSAKNTIYLFTGKLAESKNVPKQSYDPSSSNPGVLSSRSSSRRSSQQR